MKPKIFKRNCPNCNKEIFHGRNDHCQKAIKKKQLCNSCCKGGTPK